MLVSVLMPVYNAQDTIEQALKSILGQSYAKIEVVVVDDGSDDTSIKILKRAMDSRVRVFSFSNNRGLIAALNYGLDKCKGEYVLRFDADDIADERLVEKKVFFAMKNPDVDIINSKNILLKGSRKSVSWTQFHCEDSMLKYVLPIRNTISHPGVMVRRDSVEFHYLEDNNIEWFEDVDLWVRMLNSRSRVHTLDEYLLSYRIHDKSIINSKKKERSKRRAQYLFNFIKSQADIEFDLSLLERYFTGTLSSRDIRLFMKTIESYIEVVINKNKLSAKSSADLYKWKNFLAFQISGGADIAFQILALLKVLPERSFLKNIVLNLKYLLF